MQQGNNLACVIYSNDSLYCFLIYYFLEDISDPNLMEELDHSPDERWTLAQTMASWIPYEKHLAEIVVFARGLCSREHDKSGC